MDQQQEIVDKILNSSSPSEVFGTFQNWKDTYKKYLTSIHPDRCSLPKATDAITKLNGYKDDLTKGRRHKDDAGIVTYSLNKIEIIGDSKLLKTSLSNYSALKNSLDTKFKFFKKYLPTDMKLLSSNELEISLSDRAVPLSSLPSPLSPEHATWILNRLIEFSAGLNQIGFVHCGFNPDSIYVVPETHGIVCISFYHMTRIDNKLKTVSAPFVNFYPQEILTHKIATTNIDTDLSKRICIYLLGDKSGSGVRLKKDSRVDNRLLLFLQKTTLFPYDVGMEYLTLLKLLFVKKKFLILNV